jgi:glycosyltransferase involved in cell wall biosynthesis
VERVAFVTTSYPQFTGDPSGHFVETEARLRRGTGASVRVIAPGPRNRVVVAGDGVTVQWLATGDAFGYPGVVPRLRARPWNAVQMARFVVAARRTLARLAPDVIVAHWLLPSAFPIAARAVDAMGRRARLEVTVHGTDGRLFAALPRPLRHGIARALLAHDVRMRCVSEELRQELVRAAPALTHTVTVQACAIDVAEVPSRADARRALGVPPDARVTVVASRLVTSKRPDVAVRLALSQNPTHVVVLGNGPLAPSLRAMDARVTVLGLRSRHEALTWLRAADLLVSASRQEGAPTVIREARALGVRVLAVPAGDLREWAAKDPGIELIDV